MLLAEKEEEMARMEKEIIAKQEIQRKQIEIDAEAEAEKKRRIARGEAEAILAKYRAEAEGVQAVLESKAQGYQHLVAACGDRKDIAPALLLIEKMPELVAQQVKAIQNLKIDKITVWDSAGGSGGTSGGGGASGAGGATSNFLKGLIGSLPPMHELAQQAGIDLPEVLGKVRSPTSGSDTSSNARGGDAPRRDADV